MNTKEDKLHASLDIGTQNIVVLVGKLLLSGKLQIIAKSSVKTSKNSVSRGEIKSLEIVSSIKKALDLIKINYNLDIKSAYVSLSGQHISSIKHSTSKFIKNKDGAVEEIDLNELISSIKDIKIEAGKAIISALPQSYVLDGSELSSPIGMLGNKLEGVFNIVLGDQHNINLFSNVVSKSGISIAETILSSIASTRAVIYDGEQELGVMVVDIGAGTTDVSIYVDNSLKYLGVIPVGGNLINNDIHTIGILEKDIEYLKIYHGNALASKVDEHICIELKSIGRVGGKEIPKITLARIVQARCIDFITHIIGILNSTGLKSRIRSGIVLTGGVANLENIGELFEKYFDCPIRIATPNEHVDEISYDMIEDPMYSTAVGLLLEGIDGSGLSEVEYCNITSEENSIIEPEDIIEIQNNTLFDNEEEKDISTDDELFEPEENAESNDKSAEVNNAGFKHKKNKAIGAIGLAFKNLFSDPETK